MLEHAASSRYDGTALINVRLLDKAAEALLVEKPGEPLSLDDLSRVLRLVELHAISKRVLFDRTAKTSTVDKALEIRGRLVDSLGRRRLRIDASSERDPVEILDRGVAAMRMSSLLIEELRVDERIDRRVSAESAEIFRERLRRCYEAAEEELPDLAQEAIEENFRGAKCLAAIAASGPQLVRKAFGPFAAPDLDDRLVVGALINRFRLSYLNRLAVDDHGAYCPDLPFECLTREHMRLFVDYLVRAMVEDLGADPPGRSPRHLLIQNLREDLRLPPIGLLLLMSCRERGRPLELFERGEEKLGKSHALKKHLWGVTAKMVDADEVEAEVDELFRREYDQLEFDSTRPEPEAPGPVRRYLLPAVVGIVGAQALGLEEDLPFVFQFLTNVAGASSTAALCNRLQTHGTSSYLTQYHRLQHELAKAPDIRRSEAALAQQVERVFGRPLAR